jgi:signal transduction histidine kinase
MRLIVKYNWYAISIMILVFILSSIGSYFLIKRALTNELDVGLLRVMHRIQKYTDQNQKLPVINSLDDEHFRFEKVNIPVSGQSFEMVQQFIKEQNKLHISRHLIFGITINHQNYRVTITNPLEGTKHMITAMFEITVITIFILVITILLMNRAVMTRLWSPFYRAIDQLHDFNISDQKILHFPHTTTNEFNFLIENVEKTTQKAVESYRILKEFNENVSHEIQTPLAIVRSQLDLIVQDEGLNQDQSEHLIIAYQALQRLSRLNQSLLLIAKIDNHQFNKTIYIDLKGKVTDKIKEFNELWISKNIAIQTDLSESYINASPELIDIMLNNLFSNSCKHNEIDGLAKIELKAGNLIIANTGRSESLDVDKIFKRFYKEDNEPGNNGLGLSIIKKVCDQSGISPKYNFRHNSKEHVFTLNW